MTWYMEHVVVMSKEVYKEMVKNENSWIVGEAIATSVHQIYVIIFIIMSIQRV